MSSVIQAYVRTFNGAIMMHSCAQNDVDHYYLEFSVSVCGILQGNPVAPAACFYWILNSVPALSGTQHFIQPHFAVQRFLNQSLSVDLNDLLEFRPIYST